MGPWTLLIWATSDLKALEKAHFQVAGKPPGQCVLS